MSTATHSSKSLKMVIAICAVACLTTATVAWYTSKWFHTKPIEPKNHVNPYMIAATTAATIFVFQNVVKKWRSWTEQFQRLEAYLLSPVSYEHRRGTAAHRGRSALYGSK